MRRVSGIAHHHTPKMVLSAIFSSPKSGNIIHRKIQNAHLIILRGAFHITSGIFKRSVFDERKKWAHLRIRSVKYNQGFWIYLYFRIRHSFAHLRPVILSADWSISRLQSWTCSSLPTVTEFVKLTQSIVIEIQRQAADLYKVHFCGVHSDLRGKGSF